MAFLGGGTKGFLLGTAFTIAFEIGTHIIVHYTIPGANFAAMLAKKLVPVTDYFGLTSIFSESSGKPEKSNFDEYLENTPSVHDSNKCAAGGYCPIHNPIDCQPIKGNVDVTPNSGGSEFENIPSFEEYSGETSNSLGQLFNEAGTFISEAKNNIFGDMALVFC